MVIGPRRSQEFKCTLDTGSGITVLSATFLRQLGVDLSCPTEYTRPAPQPALPACCVLQFESRLILTTDGVTNHIPADTILNACRDISDPATCAEAIIEHAIRAGSRDNCTCAVIAFEQM
jgi:hypothetical protein